jgi:hypothetical protein
VDFIKMDIEGAEGPALQGGVETIARFKPRLAVVLEHRQRDLESLTAVVQRLWPERKVEYGPCRRVMERIQPEVLFVR